MQNNKKKKKSRSYRLNKVIIFLSSQIISLPPLILMSSRRIIVRCQSVEILDTYLPLLIETAYYTFTLLPKIDTPIFDKRTSTRSSCCKENYIFNITNIKTRKKILIKKKKRYKKNKIYDTIIIFVSTKNDCIFCRLKILRNKKKKIWKSSKPIMQT